MSEIDGKLTEILQKLIGIEKALKIVPDRETTIDDVESSITHYEQYALEDLKLGQSTINNQKSAIRGFLLSSDGVINKDTVQQYLDSEESDSWKSNQLKALRKYLRDYLKLGNWINEFNFTSKRKAKIKSAVPTDDQLTQFCISLHNVQLQIIFLLLHNSGLRIGEILSLRLSNINFDNNMIDASNIHTGDTKSSWISFFTQQTAEYLESFVNTAVNTEYEDDPSLFSTSYKTVQHEFKQASEFLGLALNSHALRTIFAEKCRQARIEKEYIDAFEGRTPQGILEKHYTDYSPEALRKQFDKVESYLTLEKLI